MCLFLALALALSAASAHADIIADPSSGAVAARNNKLALSLYGRISGAGKDNNVFFSPFSISTALAMTYAGARGNTERQMGEALSFSMPQAGLHAAYSSLLHDVDKSGNGDCQVKVSNALWGQKGKKFGQDFLDLTGKYYGGGFREANFANDPEGSRNEINTWVAKNTAYKIRDLLHEGDIKTATRLVLTNAIYFKGKWDTQFDEKRTRPAKFKTRAGKDVDVRMMSRSGESFYTEKEDGVRVLKLLYKCRDLSMVVILPRDGGMESLEARLAAGRLDDLISDLAVEEVKIFLPRFKFEARCSLADTLKQMGMTDAFDEMKADFAGIDGQKDLFISDVIHQADVEVNEEGTEAAAATAVIMATKSIRTVPVFKADHPFIFLIMHNPTKAILFMGKVANPNEK